MENENCVTGVRMLLAVSYVSFTTSTQPSLAVITRIVVWSLALKLALAIWAFAFRTVPLASTDWACTSAVRMTVELAPMATLFQVTVPEPLAVLLELLVVKLPAELTERMVTLFETSSVTLTVLEAWPVLVTVTP